MADVDEATSALIARMLAEDQAAAYHYGGGDVYGLEAAEDSDDSDWGGGGAKKKKKKAKGGSRAAAPKKEPKPPKEPKQKREKPPKAEGDEDPADQEYSATGRRKRKDTGKARTASRAWTDEEERLFQEALVLHGRNWKACAEHVGTRDARSFTSHAQKHFIKLCLQGKRLPPKVAESGDGYTLSGKPLDPNSAAARAYGFKPDSMQKLLEDAGEEIPGLVTEEQKEGAEAQEGEGGGSADPSALAAGAQEDGAQEQPNGSAAAAGGSGPQEEQQEGPGKEEQQQQGPGKEADSAAAGAASRKRKAATGGKENIDIQQAPAERTEYAKSRPQRRTAGVATYKQQTSESLELQHLVDFTGPVASGATGCQPFSVDISSAARLVMDFHSHLSTHEIIGLLGGLWDAEAKSIVIREAFPCRRASGSDSQTSVELDPAHEVETRALMEERGLVPVGWYHSHPTFAPTPSSKDNSNQHNYQALFRDSASGMEPFVGVIVGPYDIMLPSSTSASSVFFVQQKTQGLLPFRVRNTVSPMELPDQGVADKLRVVTEMFKDDIGRVDFTELWRPFTTLDAHGTPSGGPVTKLAKLRNALAAHLPADKFKEGEDLLDACATDIQTIWGLDLGYKV